MRKDYVRAQIQPHFERTLNEKPELGGGFKSAECLVRLIAQVLDEAAQGEDCYVSIGVTKNNDAAVMTLSLNGQRQYASGSDWPSFLASVQSLI